MATELGGVPRPQFLARSPSPNHPARIVVHVDGRTLAGTAVDLRPWSVTRSEAVDALYGRSDRLTVRAPVPGPLFDTVGVIKQDMSVPLPTVLETLARQRGFRSDLDDDLASVRRRLATVSVPQCDLTEARRRVARVGTDEAALAERVAEARGELSVRRERGDDLVTARETLKTALAELTEVRTERLAAKQQLSHQRDRARRIRDQRERRFRLQNRTERLRRKRRYELAGDVYDEFATAVRQLPGAGSPGDGPEAYDGDGVTAALAVLCLLSTATPAVLAVDRFVSPDTAADRLGVPVLRIDGP